jgi:hypothetical protein
MRERERKNEFLKCGTHKTVSLSSPVPKYNPLSLGYSKELSTRHNNVAF